MGSRISRWEARPTTRAAAADASRSIAGQLFAELPNGESALFLGEGTNSRFGHALAAGDFNDTIPGPGAGRDDLAIGVPYHWGGDDDIAFSGKVVVKQRGSNGAVQTKTYDQDSGTIADTSEGNDFFGSVLAAGDVTGDGLDDLAVGVPDEDVFLGFGGTAVDAGVVHVIPSNPRGGGLAATSTRFRQGIGGMPGTSNTDDRFGQGLTIGDFGRSHLLDLAIGSTGERAGDVFGAGAAFMVYGEGPDGLDPGTGEKWNQVSTGILDGPETGDRFGERLTAGDYNGDYDDGGRRDLAIGVPGESVVPAGGGAAVAAAGMVGVIYSTSGGLAAAGNETWHLDLPGVPRSVTNGDRFGEALR